MKEAPMKITPAMNMGTEVVKSAYKAIIGAYKRYQYVAPAHDLSTLTMMPKTRFAVAVIAFPVPLSFVGNSSGVMVYKTPYMMLLVKL
jgi:hypothetical protein